MSKIKKYFLFVGFISLMLTGCQEKKEKEEIESLALPSYMFHKIEKSTTSCTVETTNKIQAGINEWAESYLLSDSDFDEKERKIIDDALYRSIVSDKEREKLKEERDKFYKADNILIESTTTKINTAVPAKYNDVEMGYVDCEIKLQGKRDKKKFEKVYSLELLVNYENDAISVQEIGKISWK